MKKPAVLAFASFLVCIVSVGLLGRTRDSAGHAAPSAADAQIQSVVSATVQLLNSLSADQREKVQFPFDTAKTATLARFSRAGTGGKQGGPGIGPPGGFAGEQYGQAVWSNYPVSDVPRPGLRLGSLSPAQREAAMHLLRVALSPKGYGKILDIMGSDEALSKSGTPYCSGSGCYTIGIFGQPGIKRPWMLEFGGHHLGLNLTMLGEHGVMTPTLTGAQPAVYTAHGRTVRVLAEENDKAFALLNALDESQRKAAILNYRVDDLVLGPGHAGETIQSEGLRAQAMNEKQRSMLLDVISEWAGIVNDAYANPRMVEIKGGLDETYFAWSGSTMHEPGRNGSAYYRIQGPKLFIEFSPQGVGGDSTMHVHTMYRDPTNEYGRAFTGDAN